MAVQLNVEVVSKVKNVQPDGVFNDLFKFAYEFEDGNKLTAFHQTNEPRFKVGESLKYMIKKTNNYGNTGTVGKLDDNTSQENTGTPASTKKVSSNNSKSLKQLKTEQYIKNIPFALSYAKDIVTSLDIKKDVPQEVANVTVQIADVYLEWLNKNLIGDGGQSN